MTKLGQECDAFSSRGNLAHAEVLVFLLKDPRRIILTMTGQDMNSGAQSGSLGCLNIAEFITDEP